jgi:hypothetical protein
MSDQSSAKDKTLRIYALKTKMRPVVVVESRYGKGVFTVICMGKEGEN